jgi:hypothetical protein
MATQYEIFGDLIDRLHALENTAGAFYRDSQSAFNRLIPSLEATALQTLVENLESAMDQTGEYRESRADLLREHLLQNIQDYAGDHPVHLRIYEDGSVFFFDEEHAGTADDFEAADYGSDDPRRFAYWKYGIYKPGVEGGYAFIPGAPEYDDVIERRLSIWGDKAPYWYFIENGNQGGGAYPSFPGTHVFSQFEQALKEAVGTFYDSFITYYERRAAEVIEDAMERNREQKPDPEEIVWERTRSTRTHEIWQPKRGGKFIRGSIRQARE